MNRCSIIVHSVNGNCYIIATYLQELLNQRNIDARLYRVEDSDLHIWARTHPMRPTTIYEENPSPSRRKRKNTAEKPNAWCWAVPTTFGNVSAEMKSLYGLDFPPFRRPKPCGHILRLFHQLHPQHLRGGVLYRLHGPLRTEHGDDPYSVRRPHGPPPGKPAGERHRPSCRQGGYHQAIEGVGGCACPLRGHPGGVSGLIRWD